MDWIKDGKINELEFCRCFCETRDLLCIGGRLYSLNGEESAEGIRAAIAEMLFECEDNCVKTSIAKRTSSLYEALRLYCHSDPLPIEPTKIHVLNGVLNTDGTFSSRKEICVNRLNIEYSPDLGDPEQFLSFLGELLEYEDILTLQEYLGYCLIPSTKGQTALFLIGNGNEGKSRIGVVLKAIFSNAMITGSGIFHRIESDRFFRYNLINKLLMVDDDMNMSALKSTNYIKGIITAEIPIDVEAKGQQSEQGQLYSRFLCFGNGSLQTLYDKTEGFARRLLILSVKPRPQNRTDDPFIANKFLEEKNEIFLWMFSGLQRLIRNNFKFSISEGTMMNRKEAVADDCNIALFLEDNSIIEFGNEFKISSDELYTAYSLWTLKKQIEADNSQNFTRWLKTNSMKYHIKYDCNVPTNDGKHSRGFRGLRIKK